ncbi:MAG: type II secretion system protein [Candidatus Gracilibacteria bacterium]|nr:type II secretion system protein [Candidatus Gracilibacteria bacterium]MDD3120059.1 type II secretion system protein [Candidatus Gracilibacteria bacterium]MDD4530240.1 type II secretion system protein [Candidatus Gracilibacteria bacterium]
MKKKGFTIIELMAGIVIFTLGILSVFSLVSSTINISVKTREQVIASNIAREQIEFIKNIRNTNWLKFQELEQNWDNLNDYLNTPTTSRKIGELLNDRNPLYLIIENNYGDINSPININIIGPGFDESENKINKSDFEGNLYIDGEGRYVHKSTDNKPTKLKSYIKISRLESKDEKNGGNKITINEAYKIDSVVISMEKGLNKYVISTIISNWKKE